MALDAPILHDKGGAEKGNIYVDIHGEVGSVADGFAAADVVHEKTYSTSRVQHVHLETHGSITWRGDDGRLHVRTSSQAPFIAQQKLCHLFGLRPRDVHVFTERVGGGFGGKQEMISEDLCVLATLKTGRPVKWEFTREDQFIGATTRHQMTTHVKLGAKRDGTLTAIEIQVVSNTGAYGGHAGETLAAALGSPLTSYRCANKKAVGYAVYTNMVPGGGFRGYGASQTTFAIECAIDEVARLVGMDPFAIRRKNMVRPGDWIEFGLERPLRRRLRKLRARPVPRPGREDIGLGRRQSEAGGRGLGARHRHRPGDAGMRPADGAPRWRSDDAAARWDLSPCGRLHRNGKRLGDVAPSDRGLGARLAGGQHPHYQRRYGSTPYDTGTFASTGTVVAGKAVDLAANALRDNILAFAGRHTGMEAAACRLDGAVVVCGERRIALADLHAAGTNAGHRFEAKRKSYLSPRTVAFNVQGVRLAVHRVTGEIRILHSVHAADIGRLINPMQCRGQIEGAIAMGFGWALTEKMVHDARGAMVNPALRNYRIPAFADVPRTEVFFADTYDTIGPLGAKSQGECAINPVAPAVANAIANATGVRFPHLPFTPDRIFSELAGQP